jgi:hypothetical protein
MIKNVQNIAENKKYKINFMHVIKPDTLNIDKELKNLRNVISLIEIRGNGKKKYPKNLRCVTLNFLTENISSLYLITTGIIDFKLCYLSSKINFLTCHSPEHAYNFPNRIKKIMIVKNEKEEDNYKKIPQKIKIFCLITKTCGLFMNKLDKLRKSGKYKIELGFLPKPVNEYTMETIVSRI